MTAIRWTQPANGDFLGIVEWLNERNPAAAQRVGRHILDTVERLEVHPYLGKVGRSPGTRELGVARYPYLIVYTVELGAVASDPARIFILRVLHGAMLWPPADKGD
jgi:toxin ParE1/3/4